MRSCSVLFIAPNRAPSGWSGSVFNMTDEPAGVDRDDLDAPTRTVPMAPVAQHDDGGHQEPENTGVPAAIVFAGAAVLMMAVGAIGPWAKGPLGSSLSGIDGSNDGWVVLAVTLAAAVSAAAHWRAPRRGTGAVLLLCAAVNGYLTYNDRQSVQELVTSDGAVGLVSVGWGLSLALAGAVLLALAGVALIIHRSA